MLSRFRGSPSAGERFDLYGHARPARADWRPKDGDALGAGRDTDASNADVLTSRVGGRRFGTGFRGTVSSDCAESPCTTTLVAIIELTTTWQHGDVSPLLYGHDGDPEGMQGPYPASEIPQLVSSGIPTATDRQRSWLIGRRWGGYPEREWTFGIFVQRVRALGGRVPALFYEQLSDFDATRRMLRIGSHLLSRRDPTAPLVTIAFEYFDHAYRVVDGRLTLPASMEPFRGRHSVAAVDHDDLESIRFVNSWGEKWGHDGYGYVTREYFDAHVDDVWITWPATAGPSPKMAACLHSYATRRLPSADQYLHCWPTPNEYWREAFDLDGLRHELLHWNVVSLDTGRLVDVLELRSPTRIVARAHLFYSDTKGVIRELFVVPGLRQRGYGSILDGIAVDRCRSHGLGSIELWLGDGDARARLRPAAEAFAHQRGYVWTDEVSRRPNIRAVASKAVE